MSERLQLAALVVASAIIAVSCSAVVGAVTYAGWIEPDPRHNALCECC
jgi:hypothetical protein